MYRSYAALALLAAASSVTAFVPSLHRPSKHIIIAMADEDTDFDAPVPAYPSKAGGPLETEPIVDDECYMGKDNKLDECADFGKLSFVRRCTISFARNF